MAGRQHCQINCIPSSKPVEFLQDIDSDIARPYPLICQGYRYYQSFYNRVTGLFDIYLMKNKSKSCQNFKDFTALRENQSNYCLKTIHTDSTFPDWDEFCKQKGIIHRSLSAYTPEQNSTVECLNHTVLSLVCSVLYKKKLPKLCWAEIVKGVIYPLNCSPLNEDSKSAYKHLRYEKPYIEYFKVSGCLAWIYIPKEKYTKLNEYTWQGILVDYKGTNQYRILDPCTGKLHVTHDVHFNEKNIYDSKGPDTL